MGSDYPKGTCENVVYHFHGTIQTIITSYLRPVKIDSKNSQSLTAKAVIPTKPPNNFEAQCFNLQDLFFSLKNNSTTSNVYF